MGLVKDTFDKILGKVKTTGNNYLDALDKKQVELLAVKLELQEKQVSTGEIKKMVLLGEVSESAFDGAQEKLDALEKKHKSILHDMELIQQFKTSDLDTVLEELEEAKNKVAGETGREVDKLRYELMEAKHTYLQTIVDVSQQYKELNKPNRLYQDIMVKAGKQKNVYTQGSFDALHQLSIGDGGYEPLTVDKVSIYNALDTQVMPYGVRSAVKQGKKKGFIEE